MILIGVFPCVMSGDIEGILELCTIIVSDSIVDATIC